MRLPSCCRINCCSFLPALINCSTKTPFSKRFGLYWRDSIMLAGLVTTVVGAVVSFFTAAVLFGLFFTASSLVMAFGSYFVSRYAELEEFRIINARLQIQLTTFQSLNKGLEDSVKSLNQSLIDRKSELEETSRQFESFKSTNEDLARANVQLQTLTSTLRALAHDVEKAQEKVHVANSKSLAVQASIQTETGHLERIRGQIAREVTRLEGVAAVLEEHVSSLPQLKEASNALKQLAQASQRPPHLSSIANNDRNGR